MRHATVRRATTQLSFMLLSALATAVLAHNDSAVCVLTMYDFHSFATWGALVMRRTVLWAAHNSYTLIIKPFCSLQNTWCIPHEAHRVLNERADCRLLLYIDGDAMIARMDWRVPWPANSSSIVITKHASGMLNVGLFAVHNTKRARDALAWWASYGNGTCRRDLPMISFPEQVCATNGLPTLFPGLVSYLDKLAFNWLTVDYSSPHSKQLVESFRSCMDVSPSVCHPAGTKQWCRHRYHSHCDAATIEALRQGMYTGDGSGWWLNQTERGVTDEAELAWSEREVSAINASLKRGESWE